MIRQHASAFSAVRLARAVRPATIAPLAGRAAVALVFLAVLLATGVPEAAAGRQWCRTDPVLRIDGRVVRVYVSGTEEMFAAATGPTEVVVAVPVGSAVELLETDNGFGYGYAVSIVERPELKAGREKTQIAVAARVPAGGAGLPVLLELVPERTGRVAASAEGVSDAWLGTWTKV